MFKTVKNLPLPERYSGRKKQNKYELHLSTMEVNDAVEGLTGNDVQQFYRAAKSLNMKVTVRADPDKRHLGIWTQRYNTLWRIK